MPPLTYPDEIAYYGFCKTEDLYAKKAFPNNPVHSEDVLRQAQEIHSWTNAPEVDVPYEEFNARVQALESALGKGAIASAKIVLSACARDALGNSRPYDVEDIYEPLYSGINLHHRDMPVYLRVLTAQEVLGTWRGFLELSRHPCFEEEPDRFDEVLHVFRSLRTLAKEEDWIVIGIMRSYYCHNSC